MFSTSATPSYIHTNGIQGPHPHLQLLFSVFLGKAILVGVKTCWV